jgi:hypothetical protein
MTTNNNIEKSNVQISFELTEEKQQIKEEIS